MDSRVLDASLNSDAAEFVRFCYRRRRVGWPDLYDEMCSVASHRLFRGWGTAELSEHGIGFCLFEMPALARLVERVLAEDGERVGRVATPVPRRVIGRNATPEVATELRRTLVRAVGTA